MRDTWRHKSRVKRRALQNFQNVLTSEQLGDTCDTRDTWNFVSSVSLVSKRKVVARKSRGSMEF